MIHDPSLKTLSGSSWRRRLSMGRWHAPDANHVPNSGATELRARFAELAYWSVDDFEGCFASWVCARHVADRKSVEHSGGPVLVGANPFYEKGQVFGVCGADRLAHLEFGWIKARLRFVLALGRTEPLTEPVALVLGFG